MELLQKDASTPSLYGKTRRSLRRCTHAHTHLYYFLPPEKLSVEKTRNVTTSKLGKAKRLCPRSRNSRARGCCEVYPGSAAVPRRAEPEPGRGPRPGSWSGGPGSRVRHPSSRAGDGSSRSSPKRAAARDLPQRRLINSDGGWSASPRCNCAVYIFTSLQKTVNNKP